jgi:2-oxoglutarate dehydrogenase E1 component
VLGKVYYELLAYRRERKIDDIAILRLEQQYPFPHEDYKNAVGKYAQARKWCGARREPQNQGCLVPPACDGCARNIGREEGARLHAGPRGVGVHAVGYAARHMPSRRR